MAEPIPLLVDNSIFSFGMIGKPVNIQLEGCGNPLLLIEGVEPKTPWERREIGSLPTISRLAREGVIAFNIAAEITLEAWKRPGSFPHFSYGDVFAGVEVKHVLSAVERGKFFQAPFDQQMSKEAVIKFCEWLLTGYSDAWLNAPYVRKHLTDREIKNLGDIARFRALCHGASRRDYPDLFHLWTAETHGIPIFLTADAKFVRKRRKQNIEQRCRAMTPSELLTHLDISERDPPPSNPESDTF